jgi:hypothetical protein
VARLTCSHILCAEGGVADLRLVGSQLVPLVESRSAPCFLRGVTFSRPLDINHNNPHDFQYHVTRHTHFIQTDVEDSISCRRGLQEYFGRAGPFTCSGPGVFVLSNNPFNEQPTTMICHEQLMKDLLGLIAILCRTVQPLESCACRATRGVAAGYGSLRWRAR